MGMIHRREFYQAGDIIELDSDRQCTFMLMDDANFAAYQRKESFEHCGGFYNYFPSRIQVPSSGQWNVVVDFSPWQSLSRFELSVIKAVGGSSKLVET